MASYNKNYTKGQATRAISVKQDGFITGMNLDLPRDEVEATGLLLSQNMIPYRSMLEPRAGTRLFGAGPEGVTNFYGMERHPNGKFIAHWDSRLYISDDLNSWIETIGTWNPSDSRSYMAPYGDNMIIFQDDRLLILELRDELNYLRKLNAPNPTQITPIFPIDDSEGSYVYRFTYTYARYVGDTLVAESGTFAGDDYTGYYKEIKLPNALEGGKILEFRDVIAPKDSEDGLSTQWTHINVYRTVDIGINNEGYKDQYYLIQSYEITSLDPDEPGIGEMQIQGDPIFRISDTRGKLSIADEDLVGSQLLTKLFYTPIPSSYFGSVSDGVMFVYDADKSRVNFCFTGTTERVGYYFEGSQFNDISGTISGIVPIGGYSAIICKDRVYLADENSFSGGGDILGGDLGISIYALNPFKLIEANIGVPDFGTVAMVDQSRFIAVCSDASVRIFDKAWGQSDFARQMVSKEVRKITSGSTSFYHPEGYYVLSYSDNTSDTINTKTLRRGLAEDVGTGWCFYSGDGWIKPQKAKSYVRTSYLDNFMIFAVDSDNKIYWIETYNGPIGSGLTREKQDKVGGDVVNIPNYVEFPPAKGSMSSFTVRHLRTIFSLNPIDRSVSDVDHKAIVRIYKDNSSNPSDEYYLAKDLKEVVFSRDVHANTLRLSLEIDSNEVALTQYETMLEVLDMPVRAPESNEKLKLSSVFSDNLAFSMGRNINLYNNVKTMASGDKIGIDTGLVISTIGPDSQIDTGVQF